MKVYDENGKYLGDLHIPDVKKSPLRAFKTTFAMPDHPVGTVFVHDPNDFEKGNIGNGALRLAWIDGNCQNDWCGGAIGFPGQYARKHYLEWFREIPNDGRYT